MQNFSDIALFSGITLVTALRYALFAGTAWLLAYVWLRRRWFHRKVVRAIPDSRDVRREILHSLPSPIFTGFPHGVTVV